MKTGMTGFWLGTILVLFASGLATAAQPQYSATQVTTVKNGGKVRTMNSRIYVGDRKIREDIKNGQGGRSIMIVRMDKKVVYQIDPVRKTALELPFKVSPSQKMMAGNSKSSFVEVGHEIVGGTLCTKYEMRDNGRVVGYSWRSVKTGYPVMFRSADGKVVTRMHDYTPGPQADSLFEIPAGYRTMNMQGFEKSLGHAFGGMMPSLP